ncbi:MAG TPA: hypothetical protein VFS43_21080 [Polyangiaceae bacterium]|nr:hypothetical protein [Polyangiaceae bacterium]
MADPPPRLPRVLLVAGDDRVARSLGRALRASAELVMARDARSALGLLAGRRFEVVVAQLALPDGDGLAVLAEAERLCPGAGRALFAWAGPTPEAELALGEGRLAALLCRPEGLVELVALVRSQAPGGGPG